jgi:L-serine deaminase
MPFSFIASLTCSLLLSLTLALTRILSPAVVEEAVLGATVWPVARLVQVQQQHRNALD